MIDLTRPIRLLQTAYWQSHESIPKGCIGFPMKRKAAHISFPSAYLFWHPVSGTQFNRTTCMYDFNPSVFGDEGVGWEYLSKEDPLYIEARQAVLRT